MVRWKQCCLWCIDENYAWIQVSHESIYIWALQSFMPPSLMLFWWFNSSRTSECQLVTVPSLFFFPRSSLINISLIYHRQAHLHSRWVHILIRISMSWSLRSSSHLSQFLAWSNWKKTRVHHVHSFKSWRTHPSPNISSSTRILMQIWPFFAILDVNWSRMIVFNHDIVKSSSSLDELIRHSF